MAQMTYAQALSEAKGMILTCKTRISAHETTIEGQLRKIADQNAEIEQRKTEAEELRRDLGGETDRADKLQVNLNDEQANRERAEATCGRQRVQIDQMEQKAAELIESIEKHEEMIEQLRGQISDMQAELDSTRAKLPTDADKAALAEMADLLGPEAEVDEAAVTEVCKAPEMEVTSESSEAPESAPVVVESATETEPVNESPMPVASAKSERKSVFCFRQAA